MGLLKYVIFGFVIMILTLLSAGLAEGTVYYETDFEPPTFSVGKLYGQDSWWNGDTPYINVTTGQWVEVVNGDDSRTNHNYTASGYYELEFDARLNAVPTGSAFWWILRSSATAKDTCHLWCNTNDDLILRHNGGDATIQLDGCIKNVWVDIKYEINTTSQKFDFWYNGTEVQSGLTLKNTAITPNMLIFMAHVSLGAGAVNVDNLCIADDVDTECFVSTTFEVNMLNSSFSTTDKTPTVYFNWTGDSGTADCTLYNGTVGYNYTTSIANDTNTAMTFNTTLDTINYTDVYVNCTFGSVVNQSDSIYIDIEPTITDITIISPTVNQTYLTNQTLRLNLSSINCNLTNLTITDSENEFNHTNNSLSGAEIYDYQIFLNGSAANHSMTINLTGSCSNSSQVGFWLYYDQSVSVDTFEDILDGINDSLILIVFGGILIVLFLVSELVVKIPIFNIILGTAWMFYSVNVMLVNTYTGLAVFMFSLGIILKEFL